MKLVASLKKLPKSINYEVKGVSTVKKAELEVLADIDNKLKNILTGFNLVLTIEVKCELNGIVIDSYLIQNKHRISEENFNQLIK